MGRRYKAALAVLGLQLCCAALSLAGAGVALAQDDRDKPKSVPSAGETAPGKRPDEVPPEEQTNVDPYANLPAPTAKPPPPQQQDTSSNADAQQLKGVEVQGKRDVLHESDKRLKALQDSLPCAGCEVKPRKKKFVRRVLEKAINEVTPQPAPDGSHEVNDKAQQYSQDGQCIGAVDARRCAPTNAQP